MNCDHTNLIQSYIDNPTDKARDDIFNQYWPLACKMANLLYQRSSTQYDLEDFQQWSALGLMESIRTFNPKLNPNWKTYCSTKIRWVIIDEMRQADWVHNLSRHKTKNNDENSHFYSCPNTSDLFLLIQDNFRLWNPEYMEDIQYTINKIRSALTSTEFNLLHRHFFQYKSFRSIAREDSVSATTVSERYKKVVGRVKMIVKRNEEDDIYNNRRGII